MQQPTQLQVAVETLQSLATVIGILAAVGPVVVGAMLWVVWRNFISRKEFDGQGGRITAYETMMIQSRERIDYAHERLDKLEARLEPELRYIRRDLDELLDNMGHPRRTHRDGK